MAGARFPPDWRRVIPVTHIQPEGSRYDTAETAFYRGHATAWPRTHHTTKLPPLRDRVREILQRQSGKTGSGSDPAIRNVHAEREEVVTAERQHVYLFGSD